MWTDELIKDMKGIYGFCDYLKEFELDVDTDEVHCVFHCYFKDSYGVKSKSAYFSGLTEDNVSGISDWINTLMDGVKAVKELNDALRKLYDEQDSNFRVYYRFSLKNDFNSFVYDWDFDGLIVALACKSIRILRGIEDKNEIAKDTYDSIEDFIERYWKSKLAVGIAMTMDSDIYKLLSDGMNNRESVMKYIEEYEDKHYKIEITSVLTCSSLGIICKILWAVNFDTLELNVSIKDGKLYRVKDKEFIRDKEIFDGLERLYKPTAYEIQQMLK